MKTIKELCQEALDIQNASNLSGVVNSFSRAITDLRSNLRAEGKESTDAIAEHPVSVLFASKIASLTRCEIGLVFHEAYKSACEITGAKGYWEE